jgi:hypothetical protein
MMIRIDSPNAWRECAVDWLRRIDPGIGDAPAYVLDLREASGAVDLFGAGGVTSPMLSEACRPILENMGLWRGHSQFAMIVDRQAFQGDTLLGIAIHEHCHNAQHVEIIRRFAKVIGDSKAESIVNAPVGETIRVDVNPPKPWDGHGPAFGRLAIHGWYRATQLGAWIRPRVCWFTDFYGLGPIEPFINALGDEPKHLATLPLSEVIAIEPPQEYQAFSESAVCAAERNFQHEGV